MGKKTKFTRNQLFALLGVVAIFALILGGVIFYSLFNKIPIVTSPASTDANQANINIVPATSSATSTPVPTYAYKPTITPYPISIYVLVTPTLNPALIPPLALTGTSFANNPLPQTITNCLAQLNYASAVHQYYLNSIDSLHAPLITYYQNLIHELKIAHDAPGIAQAESDLAVEENEVKAEKAGEYSRYRADVASINARCQ